LLVSTFVARRTRLLALRTLFDFPARPRLQAITVQNPRGLAKKTGIKTVQFGYVWKYEFTHMDRDDLIFTLKMAGLAASALAIYVAVMLIQNGEAGDFVRLVRDVGFSR